MKPLGNILYRVNCVSAVFLLAVAGCDRSSPTQSPSTAPNNAAPGNAGVTPSPSESSSSYQVATPEPIVKPGAFGSTTNVAASDSALTLPDLSKVPAHTRRLIETAHESLMAAPGSADLPARLGMILLTNEMERESIPFFRRAIEKIPNQPTNWYYLGMALAAQNDNAGAIDAFQKSLELEPSFVYARLRLGKLLLESNKPAALAEFEALDAMKIPASDTLTELAVAFDVLDKPDAALAAARQAVELEPECPSARVALANILDKQGNKAEAAEHRAIAQSPGRCKPAPDLMYYTARAVGHPSEAGIVAALALSERGSFDLAIDTLKALSRSDPMNLNIQVALAQVYLAQGATDRALDAYKQILMSEPGHTVAAMQFARTLLNLKRYAHADKVLRAALAVHPDSPDLIELHGRVLAHADRVPEATIVYRRWIELKQGDPNARLEFVRTLLGAGHLDAALLEIKPLIQDPNSAQDALTTRASIKGLKGDAQGAEDDLRAAIAVDPLKPEPHMTLGIMLTAKKNYDRAIATLNAGLQKHPHNPVIQNALAWILATAPQSNLRDGNRALELARACCTSTRFSHHAYLDTLGTAYAELGRYDEAASTQRKAIEMAKSAGQTQLAEEYESRLALYTEGRPYRMPE